MGNKKQTLTILGRRNKQQILKDFVRPSPANTISSPEIVVRAGSGTYGNCAGGGGTPGAGGGSGGVAHEDDANCAYLWSHSGVWTDPEGNTILSGPGEDWFVNTSGVVDGQLSGRPIIMMPMEAIGSMDGVLFGASYQNWNGITATLQSNCDFGKESHSGIYGTLTITGDYFSDPLVNYPVFGISESDGYQTTVQISGTGGGNTRRLKYYASGRHVYGTLKTEVLGDTISPGWILDQWVVEDLTVDGFRIFHPTGITGNVIPFSSVVRKDPVTGVWKKTYTIGAYVFVETGSNFNTPNDFYISYERTVEWNVGVGASEHVQHFHAAYKGNYSAVTVDLSAVHVFFVDTDDYEPLPSNTRKALPMENTGLYTWEYPWQDIATVYNVFVEGLLVPAENWTWDADSLVLTLNYTVPPDAFVLADSTVQ